MVSDALPGAMLSRDTLHAIWQAQTTCSAPVTQQRRAVPWETVRTMGGS